MADHVISTRSLDRFAHHTATAEEERAVIRHLLAGCIQCQEYLSRFWPSFNRPTGVVAIATPSYDGAFEKARALLTPEPVEVLRELDAYPPLRQELLLRNHSGYWRREVCEALVDRAWHTRFSDSQAMLHSARLATLVAKRLKPSSSKDRPRIEDLRARSWAGLANALRISGDLNAAEGALRSAQAHIEAGSGELALRASLLSQWVSLRFDQRRFEGSRRLIRDAMEIWRDLYNRQEVARCLILEANSIGEGGDPQAALPLLTESERLIDPSDDSGLRLFVVHNRIRFLTDCRQMERALELHSDAEPLYRQTVVGPLFRLKLTWLKGQVLKANGHLEEAIDTLSIVQRDYLKQENRYEAALVSLELAEALGKLGRRKEMRLFATASFQEMATRRIRREALASLILLRRSA